MAHRAVLWIDHNEARCLALDPEGTGHSELGHARAHDHHTHPKKVDGDRHHADPAFFHEVERLVGLADEVALVGPAQTRQDFLSWLEKKAPGMRKKIVASERLERVTEGQLAAEGRRLLHAADAMRGVHVGRN